ncbi:hypothetical protein AC1031_016842 [Aphanomyces cochlioides]|nr:hypothetical protein AC1031_016842 [Aphanomyces cochlioides]
MATLGGQGRNQLIPFADQLHDYMNDVRNNEHYLTHTHMITIMKMHHMVWLEEYLAKKSIDDSVYASLARLCQRFSVRYCFSQRVPCVSKMTQQDLSNTRDDFAISFWEKFCVMAPCDIINVDETSIYYDMPPGKMLAKVGGSSYVDKSQKHSDRLTAVMSVRSNGDKLPILLIVKGVPGRRIEVEELPTYPPGHMCVVQESAWMEKYVWLQYLCELLEFE